MQRTPSKMSGWMLGASLSGLLVLAASAPGGAQTSGLVTDPVAADVQGPDTLSASQADAALATNDGRAARQDELEAGIAAWTCLQDDYEAFHRLQAAGVPAAPVLEGSRALEDPHAVARGVYQPQTMFDQVGTYRFVAPFYTMPETPIGVRQAPVAMGENNEYVYKQVLLGAKVYLY